MVYHEFGTTLLFNLKVMNRTGQIIPIVPPFLVIHTDRMESTVKCCLKVYMKAKDQLLIQTPPGVNLLKCDLKPMKYTFPWVCSDARRLEHIKLIKLPFVIPTLHMTKLNKWQ